MITNFNVKYLCQPIWYTAQKTLYALRDIDYKAMSKEQKSEFRKEIKEVEDIALSILDKIKNK